MIVKQMAILCPQCSNSELVLVINGVIKGMNHFEEIENLQGTAFIQCLQCQHYEATPHELFK